MRIACNLRRFREQKGISLRDAEVATGISRGQLSRIEKGRMLPTDSEAAKIAGVYGKPPITWYTASLSSPLILGDEEQA